MTNRTALLTLALATGCASSWQAGPTVLADPREVAAALGDPPPRSSIAVADLPPLPPPHHARFCCAFGMDLEVDFAGMHVPFFEVSNVVDVSALGRHSYDLPDGTIDGEPNGLMYTCRAGWIDSAHVRENADTFLFLALRIASTLANGTTIEIPGHGAPTTITIAPVDRGTIARDGALEIAASLAAWITWRISIWHEVSTWFGYQSVAGFSERPSAFSLEDLFSNVLGIHLARAVLEAHAYSDRETYERALDAFFVEALDRLDVRDVETSRAVMSALDGRWWDSTRRLPDNRLVRGRAFPPEGNEIVPWRAEDAFDGEAPALLTRACGGAETRPLSLVRFVARRSPRELAEITWAPEGWAGDDFPFARADRRVVEERDLDRLVALTHTGLEADLGPGFDTPRGPR